MGVTVLRSKAASRSKLAKTVPTCRTNLNRVCELYKDAGPIIDGVATVAGPEPEPEPEPGQRMVDGVSGTGRRAFLELSWGQIQRRARVDGLVRSPSASQERHMRM